MMGVTRKSQGDDPSFELKEFGQWLQDKGASAAAIGQQLSGSPKQFMSLTRSRKI